MMETVQMAWDSGLIVKGGLVRLPVAAGGAESRFWSRRCPFLLQYAKATVFLSLSNTRDSTFSHFSFPTQYHGAQVGPYEEGEAWAGPKGPETEGCRDRTRQILAYR